MIFPLTTPKSDVILSLIVVFYFSIYRSRCHFIREHISATDWRRILHKERVHVRQRRIFWTRVLVFDSNGIRLKICTYEVIENEFRYGGQTVKVFCCFVFFIENSLTQRENSNESRGSHRLTWKTTVLETFVNVLKIRTHEKILRRMVKWWQWLIVFFFNPTFDDKPLNRRILVFWTRSISKVAISSRFIEINRVAVCSFSALLPDDG